MHGGVFSIIKYYGTSKFGTFFDESFYVSHKFHHFRNCQNSNESWDFRRIFDESWESRYTKKKICETLEI